MGLTAEPACPSIGWMKDTRELRYTGFEPHVEAGSIKNRTQTGASAEAQGTCAARLLSYGVRFHDFPARKPLEEIMTSH